MTVNPQALHAAILAKIEEALTLDTWEDEIDARKLALRAVVELVGAKIAEAEVGAYIRVMTPDGERIALYRPEGFPPDWQVIGPYGSQTSVADDVVFARELQARIAEELGVTP